MGIFITFEGPEGSGKTTQLRLLAPYLRRLCGDVLVTREPGGTSIGDRVRAVLLDPEGTEMLPTTEFLLFSAARAQHVGQVIRPRLERGGIVLCDRFADSSLAYQGYGHRQDIEILEAVTRYATAGLTPDLTLLLDVPVEAGLQRKTGGGGDSWNRMEQKEIEFHERVREGYLSMAAQEPDRWHIVDATGSAGAVQSSIRRTLKKRSLADRWPLQWNTGEVRS